MNQETQTSAKQRPHENKWLSTYTINTGFRIANLIVTISDIKANVLKHGTANIGVCYLLVMQ